MGSWLKDYIRDSDIWWRMSSAVSHYIFIIRFREFWIYHKGFLFLFFKGNLHSHNKYCLKCSKYAIKEIYRLKKYSIQPNKFFSESKVGLRSKFKSPAIRHLDQSRREVWACDVAWLLCSSSICKTFETKVVIIHFHSSKWHDVIRDLRTQSSESRRFVLTEGA